MKNKQLYLIITLLIIGITICGWLIYKFIQDKSPSSVNPNSFNPTPFPTVEVLPKPELAKIFQDQIIAKGVELGGQPIEGFDAFLLLNAFPGLTKQDFNNVETFEGIYQLRGTELTYTRTQGGPVTSAEQTISDAGYATLLQNISNRLNIRPKNNQDISNIVQQL